MFEGFKYRRKTKGYFNPEKNTEVSRDQFIQILQGQVINPQKLKNISAGDYAYMVVGVSANNPLNSWAGKDLGPYGHDHAQTNADWYGRFSCEEESCVIFPNQLVVSYFEPRSRHFRAKKFDSLENMNISLLDSSSPVFTDRSLRVLVSDLSVKDISKLLQDCRDSYSSR